MIVSECAYAHVRVCVCVCVCACMNVCMIRVCVCVCACTHVLIDRGMSFVEGAPERWSCTFVRIVPHFSKYSSSTYIRVRYDEATGCVPC
jgi:hypothetical protein